MATGSILQGDELNSVLGVRALSRFAQRDARFQLHYCERIQTQGRYGKDDRAKAGNEIGADRL